MTDEAGDGHVASIATAAEPLLEKAGVGAPFHLDPVTGGGNNRVFRVEAANGTFILKVYFRHAADPRDRLNAEFDFGHFAWLHGIRSLPRPITRSRSRGMAVYEHIAGRRLVPGEVTRGHLAEASAFSTAVNTHRGDPRAARLPEAAEACFSIAAHLECVARRIDRLAAIDVDAPLGRTASVLVSRRLSPAWEGVRAAVLDAARDAAETPLAAADRCLSPSDFGFHNAILAPDDRLRFFDFEYAGWDDPAKMVCDFFCQPAVPVPRVHLPDFVQAVEAAWPDRDDFAGRVALLLPVYELKWCCIMLNEFLPAADSRRTFAGRTADRNERQAEQLVKVAAALDRMGA